MATRAAIRAKSRILLQDLDGSEYDNDLLNSLIESADLSAYNYIKENNPNLLATTVDVTIPINTSSIALATLSASLTDAVIINIYDITDGEDEIEKVNYIHMKDLSKYQKAFTDEYYYSISGVTMYIAKESGSALTWRVWYVPKFTAMTGDTDSPDYPTLLHDYLAWTVAIDTISVKLFTNSLLASRWKEKESEFRQWVKTGTYKGSVPLPLKS